MSDNGAKCTRTIQQNVLLLAILVIESVVIITSMVFTSLTAFTSDEDHYKSYQPDFASIIGYHFLMPIFVYQVIWLLTNIASVVTVHTDTPYIFIFTILVPLFGLLLCVVILVPSVDYIISHNFEVSGLFLGCAIGLAVFVIFLILSTISRISTLRKMMKKKKVIQTTGEKTPEDPEQVPVEPTPAPIKDPDEISISFSRRSTMSMNDEFFVPPPRR